MKKLLVLVVMLAVMAGCATTTGKDIGGAIEFIGAAIGAVVGFDASIATQLGILVGTEATSAIVVDAIDKDGLKQPLPDEEKPKEGP